MRKRIAEMEAERSEGYRKLQGMKRALEISSQLAIDYPRWCRLLAQHGHIEQTTLGEFSVFSGKYGEVRVLH